MTNPIDVLKKYFGYNKFRKNQEDIIKKVITGENVSVIIPTGGGKSLCYQIPSIVRKGIGVIVSPLIALMADQVNALKANGVNAAYINSTLSSEEKRDVVYKIEKGEIDLIYVSPELLFTDRFFYWLKKQEIALFAIDEVHCLSQWGHDFRPEYTKLAALKEHFPNVPRIALTATANEMTRTEIREVIGIEKENEFSSGFDRPNIMYQIQDKDAEIEFDQLQEYIEENHDSETGIVYCLSRKRTEDVAKHLRRAGMNAYHYHAGLTHKERSEILARFTEEDSIIIVATIAFGMGIDKPNVRFVCHMDLPSSIEAYYQETGRAGRDGEPAVAWMLFGIEDVVKREGLINKSQAEEVYKNIERNNLKTMYTLCEMAKCRRQILIGYFGDHLEKPCNNCDNCLQPKPTVDATIIAQKALSTIMRTKQQFGVQHIIDVLLGNKTAKVQRNKHDELSVFGVGQELPRENWKIIFRQLIVLGYVEIEPHYNALWLTKKSLSILKEGEKLSLSSHVAKKSILHRQSNPMSLLSMEDKILMKELKNLRFAISKREKVPAYVVFNDETLKQLILRKPLTISQFERIDGIGFAKARKFGESFTSLIKENQY